MPAYLFLLIAVASRLALGATPHPEWFNFTAVGGMLLYFGARRSWREMLAPLAVLMATDYFLTVNVYHYAFQWPAYVPTWTWYIAAMVLGQILLKSKTTFVRVGAAALLGPTSFFLLSNYAVWAGGGMYPRTMGGLGACIVTRAEQGNGSRAKHDPFHRIRSHCAHRNQRSPAVLERHMLALTAAIVPKTMIYR